MEYENYDEMTTLPLTKDLVFKAVFGNGTEESNAALKALLDCLLERQDDPIRWVECKNPFTYQERKNDKSGIMDIRAQLNSGEVIDLEMQVNHLDFFKNRTTFYLGKMISKSLEKGQSYDKMKKSIIINIVVPVLFPETDQAYHCFFLSERTTKMIFNDIAQIRFLELGKLHLGNRSVDELSPIELVGLYFKYSANQKYKDYIDKLKNVPFGEVISLSEPILKKISADERVREMLEDQERYEHDEATRRYVREQHEARIQRMNEDLKTRQAEFDERQAEFDERQAEFDERQAEFDERQAEFDERQAELEIAIDLQRKEMDQQKELTTKLVDDERFVDLKRSLEDVEYRKQLLREYGLE